VIEKNFPACNIRNPFFPVPAHPQAPAKPAPFRLVPVVAVLCGLGFIGTRESIQPPE